MAEQIYWAVLKDAPLNKWKRGSREFDGGPQKILESDLLHFIGQSIVLDCDHPAWKKQINRTLKPVVTIPTPAVVPVMSTAPVDEPVNEFPTKPRKGRPRK